MYSCPISSYFHNLKSYDRLKPLRLALLAAAVVAGPDAVVAQSVGGLSGGSGSGLTSPPTRPAPTSPSVSSAANALGSAGSNAPGLAQENNWTLSGFTDAGASSRGGSSAAATQQAASAGSTDLNSVNAGTIATSGNPNSASATGATTIGNSTGSNSSRDTTPTSQQSIAGTGRPQDFVIPKPRIGVDLRAIRVALASRPSATPQVDGD